MWLVVSDTHIGDRQSNKNLPKLFKLLEEQDANQTLILNGDIIDFSKFVGFDERHRIFFKLIQRFKKVIYVEGNHDWFVSGLKNCIPTIEFVREYFIKINNNIIKIFHGHEKDPWICYFPRLVRFLTKLNRWIYELTGVDVQHKLASRKNKKFLYRQEKRLIRKEQEANILVVGHIHRPCFAEVDETIYCNTGDWTDKDCYYAIIDDFGDISLNKCE